MNTTSRSNGSQPTAFEALRRFAPRQVTAEQCDLCSLIVGSYHQHLLQLAERKILCACDACALLFNDEGGKYKRIPRTVKSLPQFRQSDEQWNSLAIPIGLAFFFHDSIEGKLKAFYPSPAGATESLLDLEAWNEVVRNNAPIQTMQPDVEALLVNRIGEARNYYIAPIDQCYQLVGIIRVNWRGLSGGNEVWNRIDDFFRDLTRTIR